MVLQRLILAVSLWWVCLGNAACNSGPAGEGEAGTLGGDGATEAAGGKVSCDTSAQKCPAGMTCDITCVGGESQIACRPVAQTPTAKGDPCGGAQGLAQTCALGTSCLASSSSNGAHCVGYCTSDADCPGATCQERSVSRGCGATKAPTFTVKICLP